ncbi:MAG TPA: S46 family peptidase, partial [Vicinamibacterales bacterium]|nr:S46 family peptidase [Vicinamibacterales bacterium]
PEYSEARKAAIERQMAAEAPIHPGAEQAKLEASLVVMQQLAGANHPLVTQILGGKTPQAKAAELVAGTKMGDPATRKELFAGGKSAVDASTDPFIQLAKLIDPRARELRTKYDNEVLGVERDAYAKIAQAVFAAQGDAAYPDGTFTLRLSYGQVKGYMENGKAVTPFTEIRGLFIRGDQHKHKPPYKIADSWMNARAALKPTTPYNFVSTNDIVGGNSGSPVINVKGELVGLIFDGNIQSLPGYFIYDAAVNRAVSVDARGMLEALRVVYKANALADELTGTPATKTAAQR